MRVIVYPHTLDIGGSQINAIELAAGVRDRGHEVLVYGQPGPLLDQISALGLPFTAAPRPRGRPSPNVLRSLTRLARERDADLVHGHEWTAALEAYWGPLARAGIPAVGSVMSMSVAPFLPADLPLLVGTEQIGAAQAEHSERVGVLEPPVDVRLNAPGAADPDAFRRRWRLDERALTVVSVGRLAAELKMEGTLAAIEAVAAAPPSLRLQLVIVGDGPGREWVEARAAAANSRAGRRIVVLTGELADPRPAYAAADVFIGMGGSALRAMAFERAVVVQGEEGFWELVDERTRDGFLWAGWYGVGESASEGPPKLLALLRELEADPLRRRRLGERNRRLIESRFSLEHAAERLAAFYEATIAARPAQRTGLSRGAGISLARLARYRLHRRVAATLGRDNADDFNSRPLAATGGAPAPDGGSP